MFLKRFLLGSALFGFLLALPFLIPVLGLAQEPEPYSFILKWGGAGIGPGEFNGISGLAIDSLDNIYVVDRGNCRIQKFDKYGTFILEWPILNAGDDHFLPNSIGLDKNGNVYVNQAMYPPEAYRIQKFDGSGGLIQEWRDLCFLRNPGGIDTDSDGNIFMAACFPCDGSCGPTVIKYDSNFERIGGFGYSGHDDSNPYNFWYPGSIAINSAGDIYSANWGESYCGLPHGHDPELNADNIHYHSQIKKFDSSFQFITRWYLEAVTSIAIDAEDNVFACSQRDWDMGVYKYDANGTLIQRIAPNGQGDGEFWSPHHVAVDSEGNVYVVDMVDGSYNRIQKFAPPRAAYTFEGFFSPIENLPVVNQARAGQAIPVKWRILDKDGLPISDPASFVNLTSYPVSCSTFEGDPTNLVEESEAGSSGLQYLGDGWWQYNWKTSKAYQGQCRVMMLTLDDKSEHKASFSFK